MSDLNEPTFQEELEVLINKHSLERHSNTPDFILAEYMADCLHNFNRAVFARTKFYVPVGEAVEQCVQRIGGTCTCGSDTNGNPYHSISCPKNSANR